VPFGEIVQWDMMARDVADDERQTAQFDPHMRQVQTPRMVKGDIEAPDRRAAQHQPRQVLECLPVVRDHGENQRPHAPVPTLVGQQRKHNPFFSFDEIKK